MVSGSWRTHSFVGKMRSRSSPDVKNTRPSCRELGWREGALAEEAWATDGFINKAGLSSIGWASPDHLGTSMYEVAPSLVYPSP